MLAPFSGGKAGRECAEEQRRRHPKRKLRCITSRPIRIGFCLLYDGVHALFRIGLTQADIGGDQVRHRFGRRAKVRHWIERLLSKVARPQPARPDSVLKPSWLKALCLRLNRHREPVLRQRHWNPAQSHA